MTTIKISVTGLDGPAARLDEIGSAQWKHGMLALVGGLVQRQTVNRIRSEKTDPGGAAWAKWAISTARRKRKGDGLLVGTGVLMGSIEASVAGDRAIIGTNVFYGAFLQDGTSKMPARPFLGISKPNESEIMAAVRSFVLRTLSS